MVDKTRIRPLNNQPSQKGPVIYWLQRDQRVSDNWALIYAQEMAVEMKQPLAVVFCLLPQLLDAAIRQYQFMIDGLKEVEKKLCSLSIPFYVLKGQPDEVLPRFLEETKAACLITDFNPLKIPLTWKKSLSRNLTIPFLEVDAHNIIPCWIAWSIGGVHDRPWGTRPVFGMIRYMNYNGCLRKFNVKAYLSKINSFLV